MKPNNKPPNKVLHPTAYSLRSFRSGFRRRVSLVVVLLRLRDGNRVWSTPVADMLPREVRVLASALVWLILAVSGAAFWFSRRAAFRSGAAFGFVVGAAFRLGCGFWFSAADTFRL